MRKLGALLFVAAFSISAAAQSGQWGARGISRQFAVDGDLLIDADGRGVAIYDVADPARPARVQMLQTDSESIGVAMLAPNRIVLATRTELRLYDYDSASGALGLLSITPKSGVTHIAGIDGHIATSDASGVSVWQEENSQLVPSNRFSVTGVINAMAFHDDRLFVAVERMGIFAFSLTTSDSTFLAENSKDLAVSGNTLYSAGGVDGLLTIDVSNGGAAVTGRTGAGEGNLLKVAATDTRVFATDGTGTVQIYDHSAVPNPLATISEPADTIAGSGSTLFVSGSIVDRNGLSNYTGAPVRSFDTASLPVLLGEYRDSAGPLSGVATDGSLAYVADPPFFRVIDISTTATPREIASLQVDNLGDLVKFDSGRAIVYGRGDVQLIDVTHPYAPTLVTVFHSNGIAPSRAAFSGDTFLEGNPASGFHVLEVLPGGQNTQIAGVKGHYFDVVADGPTAYIFEQVDMRVVDLASRGSAVQVLLSPIGIVQASIVPATAAHPAYLLGYALDGLHIYSLENRLAPHQRSVLALPQGGIITGDGDTAWFATPGSITKINLADPSHPTLQSTDLVTVWPMQMASASGKLVIADGYSLRIYGPDTAAPPPPPVAPVLRRRAVQ